MKYLGVDYGIRKIGLAISEGELASGFGVLNINSLDDAVAKISKIVIDEGVQLLVVGIPEGETSKLIRKFIEKIKKFVAVVEADETLSSQNAKLIMISLGKNKTARKKEDAYAAALILQNYLDSKD